MLLALLLVALPALCAGAVCPVQPASYPFSTVRASIPACDAAALNVCRLFVTLDDPRDRVTVS